jgi:hypothetical protein
MEQRIDQATGALILRRSIFEIDPSTPRRADRATAPAAVAESEPESTEAAATAEGEDSPEAIPA